MAKERRKVVVAGPLWFGCQYRASMEHDADKRRAARSQISSPARESLNAKYSWQKLMLLLACNFSPTDLVATLTYRDSALPKRPEDADKCMDRFIRLLRAERKANGADLRYIRVTEGKHSSGRYHHHLVFNATGQDFHTIRNLWYQYGDDIKFDRIGFNGYQDWARYLTKEPREHGRRHIGDRTWRASVGLKKPITTYEFVNESDVLCGPPGAIIIDRTECNNCYGRFVTLMSILPESARL